MTEDKAKTKRLGVLQVETGLCDGWYDASTYEGEGIQNIADFWQEVYPTMLHQVIRLEDRPDLTHLRDPKVLRVTQAYLNFLASLDSGPETIPPENDDD